MHLAFLVERFGYYKFYGSLVREAVARGHEVSCWHDYGAPKDGAKGYLFPEVEKAPAIVGKYCRIDRYHGPAGILELAESRLPDFIVSLRPPLYVLGQLEGRLRTFFVVIQSAADNFLYVQKGGSGPDLHCVYAPHWIELGRRYYASLGQELLSRYDEAVGRRAVIIGYPGLACANEVKPAEVRTKWGIGQDQPVVLLLPIPLNDVPKAWVRVFGAATPLAQLRESIRVRSVGGVGLALRNLNERSFMQALRRFCDVNRAVLLVKGRRKSPIGKWACAMADKVLYDEGEDPPTTFEALKIASLCVHFQSFAALEAAAIGCPSLCIEHPGFKLYEDRPDIQYFLSGERGHMFNFPGVSEWMALGEAVGRLPSMSLSQFRMEPHASERYVETFLTTTDPGEFFAALARYEVGGAGGRSPGKAKRAC